MTVAVSFDHVSKHYRGPRGYSALRDQLASLPQRLVGRGRTATPAIPALDDVSFDIHQGDSIAIMGPNGSGKTTALKLISRITYPSAGTIRVRGRVGALIEVGTGLHPELTGRENVQLYGRILGLSGRDIKRRFDSILDFAEIGSAIDQPVKQYSSGMQLRLGFSLAAHLEPEVLLVDEAVSVGDAGFQLRCMERMGELVSSGVTLLFVSHIPALVSSLCRTGILLDHGRTAMVGPAGDVIDAYLALVMGKRRTLEPAGSEGLSIQSWDWEFQPSPGRFLGDLLVRVSLSAGSSVRNPRFGVGLSDGRPGNLVACSMLVDGFETGDLSGSVTLRCQMRDLPLEPGPYTVWISAMTEKGISYLIEPRPLGYAMLQTNGAARSDLFAGTNGHAAVRVPYHWEVTAENHAS